MALFVAGVVLSLVDAIFSVHLRGGFQEVNPLLRPLLATPALFLLAKAVFTTAGFYSLARLDHSRAAAALLVAGVTLYLAVDGYWLWRVLH